MIVLKLTRLNEADSVIINWEAVDAAYPCGSGDPGCVLLLRGGHIIRVVESADELVQRVLEEMA